MSLETVQFGLPDPLQANVTVKAYDCLALFLDVNLLEDNSASNASRKASVIQTLTEFTKLVNYYHDNGTLTTFYIGNINDNTTKTSMDAMTYNAATTNGWVLMWIRGGGKLENNAMHISGGISASILDDMLRYNPRHDPAIDSILAFSSLLGPDGPVAASDSYKLLTPPNATVSAAPTAFTMEATTSTTMPSSNNAKMQTSVLGHHNTAPKSNIHWMFIGLALLTTYVVFVRKA